MNHHRAAALVPMVALLATASTSAQANPITVQVRIEGVRSTIFDHAISADAREVRAISDAGPHRCDGTNNGANDSAGATPTSVGATAVEAIGERFDGQWYPGLEDYFIRQWGSEAEMPGLGWYWGVRVNGASTPVGGCQYKLAAGDEVVWAGDAFSGRPFLTLSGPTVAVVGQPIVATVTARSATKALGPYAGATVSGVDDLGRPLDAAAAASAPSAADGTATVTFQRSGWQRLKARVLSPAGSSPAAIASGTVDMCVKDSAGAAPCGGTPPSKVPFGVSATPMPSATPTPVPVPTASPAPVPAAAGPAPTVPRTPLSEGTLQLGAPAFSPDGSAAGRIGVRWSITSPGPGVRSWAITSRPASKPAAAFTPRESGSAGTATTVLLPAGQRALVRLTVIDAAGQRAGTDVGTVLVPRDDRASGVQKRGRWTTRRDRDAWRGSYGSGGVGATLTARVAAGRPVVFIRGVRRSARIELRAAGRREVFAIAASRSSATRQVHFSKAVRPGTLQVRVVRGSVGIDGIAVD